MTAVASRAIRSSCRSGRPRIARGMSSTTAAAPILRKLSAVDMTAAKIPANTTPARTGFVYAWRKSGAAASGWASSGCPPVTTRARMASPIPVTRKIDEKLAKSETTMMLRRSPTRLNIMCLVITCGCPAAPRAKTSIHDRPARMPTDPNGAIVSGSSAAIASLMPVIPPVNAARAARKTRIDATIITAPWNRSV